MTREDIVRKLGGNRTRCDDQDIIPTKKKEKNTRLTIFSRTITRMKDYPGRGKFLDFWLELLQPKFHRCYYFSVFVLSLKTSEQEGTNNGTDSILIINCRVHYYEARRRRVNRFRCAHRYRMRVIRSLLPGIEVIHVRAGEVLKPETIVVVSRGRDDFLCNRLALIHAFKPMQNIQRRRIYPSTIRNDPIFVRMDR